MSIRVRRLMQALCACALAALLAACAKSEPPAGTVRTETEDAVVNAAMLTHGYSWDGVASDPVAPTELADSDVPDLAVSGTAEVRASFSQPANEVEVVRYADDGTLEGVECALEDGAATFVAESGWRYYVGAWFEGGDAGYLFDAKGAEGERADMDEFVSTAMVVTFGDGEVLFVDQDTGSPYYPTLPESAPELTAGNIVRVTGTGIMLQSYPGQYPGITKVEVVEEGSPADAEKYDELVAQIWHPKDPAELPYASLEYTTELAAVSLMLQSYGYTWSYEENGETTAISADSALPAQLAADELPDVSVDAPTEVTASFDVPATGIEVTRWSEDALDAEGEPVETDGLSFTVEPGYRYALLATFDAGEVTYVFTVR